MQHAICNLQYQQQNDVYRLSTSHSCSQQGGRKKKKNRKKSEKSEEKPGVFPNQSQKCVSSNTLVYFILQHNFPLFFVEFSCSFFFSSPPSSCSLNKRKNLSRGFTVAGQPSRREWSVSDSGKLNWLMTCNAVVAYFQRFFGNYLQSLS